MYSLCDLGSFDPLALQCTIPVGQLDRGQLLEGWFPLFAEDGSTIAKHQPMLNLVLQYQSVLQVGRCHTCFVRLLLRYTCTGHHTLDTLPYRAASCIGCIAARCSAGTMKTGCVHVQNIVLQCHSDDLTG